MNQPCKSIPLVSIIVPAYKVEKYLAKCIESIRSQTIKDLEIIIIDDGSPDESGHIANEQSIKDSRIRVINTKNFGVSAARNLGIENAQGKYISFVDGDDYLEPDFVEYMLNIFEKTGADLVISRNCYKSPFENQIKTDKIEIYSPERAASEFLYPYIDIGCWNKMYLKEFIERNFIKFPVNFYMGEGLNFIVEAAQLSNFVGVGRKKVYHYRKDNPSSATTKISIEKFINALAAIDNIDKKSFAKSKKFISALSFHRYITTYYALNAIIRTNKRGQYPTQYKQWSETIKNDVTCIFSAHVHTSLKLKHFIYSFNPCFWLTIRSYLAFVKKIFITHLSRQHNVKNTIISDLDYQ